jgi:hypothetical protein
MAEDPLDLLPRACIGFNIRRDGHKIFIQPKAASHSPTDYQYLTVSFGAKYIIERSHRETS